MQDCIGGGSLKDMLYDKSANKGNNISIFNKKNGFRIRKTKQMLVYTSIDVQSNCYSYPMLYNAIHNEIISLWMDIGRIIRKIGEYIYNNCLRKMMFYLQELRTVQFLGESITFPISRDHKRWFHSTIFVQIYVGIEWSYVTGLCYIML